MHSFFKTVAAAGAITGIAAPAAAQYYPQTAYPQPAYPQQAYPGTAYGQYGYGQVQTQNPVQQIIDGLLGNRYQTNDRTAVTQCASAALAQAQAQYRGYGYQQQGYGYQQQGYGYQQQGYGYGQNIAAPAMRVTAISNVERRNNGLRVRGLISTGYAGNTYNQAYQNGYQNQAGGDLSFRCNVDYRGVVTGVRVSRNDGRRY